MLWTLSLKIYVSCALTHTTVKKFMSSLNIQQWDHVRAVYRFKWEWKSRRATKLVVIFAGIITLQTPDTQYLLRHINHYDEAGLPRQPGCCVHSTRHPSKVLNHVARYHDKPNERLGCIISVPGKVARYEKLINHMAGKPSLENKLSTFTKKRMTHPTSAREAVTLGMYTLCKRACRRFPDNLTFRSTFDDAVAIPYISHNSGFRPLLGNVIFSKQHWCFRPDLIFRWLVSM